MATPAVVVLVSVALVTVVAVAVVVWQLVRRLRGMVADLRAVEARLMPMVTRLEQRTEVTGHELERVSQAMDALERSRTRR